MSSRVTSAAPAAGRAGSAAAPPVGAAAPWCAARLRFVLLALGPVVVLLLMVLVACELAAARAPQHRAELEELIRHETGLEVSFSELSLGWGWHGPEAVFHAVMLGEPGGGTLLRAPRLIVALDLWRMARSGRFEAGRITLVGAEIDLAASAPDASHAAEHSAGSRWSAGARILSHWRGGLIEIERGTVRGLLPGAAPAMLTVRYALLRRLGADWNAEARMLLPESLGESVRLVLQMRGEPEAPQSVSGTVNLEGRRLALGGWRALSPYAQGDLPQAGAGNVEVHLSFAGGRLVSAGGTLHADGLEWPAPSAAAAPVTLERLRGVWQLVRRGGEWRLGVSQLETSADSAAAQGATLLVDLAADGTWARGHARHAPLAALALLARGSGTLPFLGQLTLAGEARDLSFEWSARRPAGARLVTRADLSGLTVGTSARDWLLRGVSGRLSGTERHLQAELESQTAQLAVPGEHEIPLVDPLKVTARLALDVRDNGGWQLSGEELQLRGAGASLAASGSIGAAAGGATARVSAHLSVKDADIALLAGLLGPQLLSTLGPAATRLTGGRLESAELTWHDAPAGGAPWDGPPGTFIGRLALRDAQLSGDELWPDSDRIDARILWRGPRLQARIEHARTGSFDLRAGRADWDARGAHPLHFAARVTGSATEAVEWLRAHPQLAPWATAGAALDLRGNMGLDLDLTLPGAAHAAGAAGAAPPRVRLAATLDGAQLRLLPGLPPIEALRGSLAVAGGRLQRSAFSGQWLGGPVSLSAGERRDQGVSALAISGRGLIGAREALQAAGGDPAEAQLAGSAEWSALLTFFPQAEAPATRWQLHADSALIGVASRLPEPFAKSAGAPLPLHVDVQGASDTGQLRVSLGDRLWALAALVRSGDRWRIERGAVRLAATPPSLPAEPVMFLDGRLSRLELAACLGLWRAAAHDEALPELRARLSAGQLLAGARSYADVNLAARVTGGGGVMQLESAELLMSAQWPALIEREHPATVHLASFNIGQPGDLALAAALAAVLSPATELSIDELKWQGHSLGRFDALLAAADDALEVSGLHLAGAAGDVGISAQCAAPLCRAHVSLASTDAAASLSAFGLRPDVSAADARLEADVQWSPQAPVPLATLAGHLHMDLTNGFVHAGAPAEGIPFALLSVPALLAGGPAAGATDVPRALEFARLTGDFELHDGQAITSGLHFDGDAEILVRGRVGLAAGDYDEQAWILSGEERLPAALRRLGPTPRMAALWLSLREWLAGSGADRPRAPLRLRGSWNDPVVTPAE
jgi:uncharacterized protein YhdP